MDKKDERIIEVLSENSRLSSQKIAKKTQIPITTVHNRLKNLVKDGIIKKFTLELDNNKIGKQVSAYISISVNYNDLKTKKISQHDLAKKLRNHPAVESAAMITGEFDILLKVRFSSVKELDDFVTTFLRNIEGVERTQTLLVLNEG